MLLKLASRNTSPIGINIKRLISKTPTNLRINSPSLKKKFTPQVNKSFTSYKEKIPSKHQRTYSLEKNKESLSGIHRSKNRSAKLSLKILSQTRELSLDSAKSKMSKNDYAKALEILNDLHRIQPDNTEILYSRGVCFMHLHQNQLAIDDLLKVAEIDTIFDKQLYIALYMCYMSLNSNLLALKYLSRGLRRFPNFTNGLIIRGQLFNKLQIYEKALKDFKRVLGIEKKQNFPMLYMAESLIGLKD